MSSKVPTQLILVIRQARCAAPSPAPRPGAGSRPQDDHLSPPQAPPETPARSGPFLRHHRACAAAGPRGPLRTLQMLFWKIRTKSGNIGVGSKTERTKRQMIKDGSDKKNTGEEKPRESSSSPSSGREGLLSLDPHSRPAGPRRRPENASQSVRPAAPFPYEGRAGALGALNGRSRSGGRARPRPGLDLAAFA